MDIVKNIEVCLNCELPECDESNSGCQFRFPKQEVEMTNTFTSENYAKRQNNALKYKERKPEIISVFNKYQSVNKAARELGMPSTTLRGLLIKWQVYKPKDRYIEKIPEVNITPHVNNTKPNGKKDIDLIPLIDRAFDMPSLELAKAFWDGVKSVVISER